MPASHSYRPGRAVCRLLRRWHGDARGAVLVMVTLTLPVVLGFAAIVVDLGRLAGQQTELQSFADHIALAAAGELDGAVGARDRAMTAARLITADRQTFAAGTIQLGADADVIFRFLRALPASDDTPITDAFVAGSDGEARFVEATVRPRTVAFGLTRAFSALFGGSLADGSQVGATGVAGSTQMICDVTPLYFCLPQNSGALQALYDDPEGRMLRMRTQSNGGNWGLVEYIHDSGIDCGPNARGKNYWRCATARVEGLSQCFERRAGQISTEPGKGQGPAASGLNTRFDIYETSMQKESTDLYFAPAPNVIKGWEDDGCKAPKKNSKYDDTIALPRSSCFAACTGDAHLSSPDWPFEEYMEKNHGSNNLVNNFTPNSATTRYELYRQEIEAAGGGRILPDTQPESGRAQCATRTWDDPDRRVIVVAAIDCGGLNGRGAATVESYWRVFLTEPVVQSVGEVWVELIERIEFGDETGILRDVVQLYR